MTLSGFSFPPRSRNPEVTELHLDRNVRQQLRRRERRGRGKKSNNRKEHFLLLKSQRVKRQNYPFQKLSAGKTT